MHTPASFEHNYGGGDDSQVWEKFFADLEALPPHFKVLGINDYLEISGYRQILAARATGRLQNIQLVLPVIELRIARFAGHDQWHRVNFHVLFSDQVDPDTIEQEFLTSVNASYTINEGDIWSGPPVRPRLEELGRRLKAAFPPITPVGDLQLGVDNYNIEPEAIREILSRSDAFRGRYLTAIGKAEWDQMAWTAGSIAEKRSIINSVDFVFTASPSKANFDRSLDKLDANQVQSRLLHCSDAHHFSGSAETNRIGHSMTWVKAEPTFEGLVIARHEYEQRIFVGDEPPALRALRESPTKYLRDVSFSRNQAGNPPWFDGSSVELNSGLVAIIGNKGSGKSALTDGIALVADADVEGHLSFLSPARFRNVRTGEASEFRCSISWHSGDIESRTLSDSVNHDKPERVRYLPQNYFEKLCSDVGEEAYAEFEGELKRVVFSWLPMDRQLGKGSLDELIIAMTAEWRERRRLVARDIAALNREISVLERTLQPNSIRELQARLAERNRELEAHDASKPPEPDQEESEETPAERSLLDQIEGVAQVLEESGKSRATLTLSLAEQRLDEQSALGVRRRVENIRYYINQQVNETEAQAEFQRLGLSPDQVVTLSVNESLLALRLSEIQAAVAASNQRLAEIKGQEETLTQQRDGLIVQLDARRQAIRLQREAVKRWSTQRLEIVGNEHSEGSLSWLQAAVAALPGKTSQLALLETRRGELFDSLFSELVVLRDTYRSLFSPIQEYLGNEPLLSQGLTMTVDALIRNDGFAEVLLGHVDQSKRGQFFQGGGEPVRELVAKADFDDVESAHTFVREVLALLRPMDEGRPKEDVERQLRSRSTREQVYDLLFGLEYLSPHYALKFNDKEISQLSPGERGAALLIFFVLVDRSQIPIVLDQPEENLDNETVSTLLVPAIREARKRRQVIIVTHNPNLAVYCDADQIILAELHRVPNARITYRAGAIEQREVRKWLINVLEGTGRAFGKRHVKYSIGEAGELIFEE